MREELDAHSEAVLAYPQTLRIDEYGALVDKEPRVFDTSGVAEARRSLAPLLLERLRLGRHGVRPDAGARARCAPASSVPCSTPIGC